MNVFSSALSYSIARFCTKRKFRRLGNLLVLSTVFVSELNSMAHSFLMSAGSFLSIMLTELVIVISVSKPSLFRSLYPSSIMFTNSTSRLLSPSFMNLNRLISFIIASVTLAGSP